MGLRRAEIMAKIEPENVPNVVHSVVHCYSITSYNKLKIKRIGEAKRSALGSPKGHHLGGPFPYPYHTCRTEPLHFIYTQESEQRKIRLRTKRRKAISMYEASPQ